MWVNRTIADKVVTSCSNRPSVLLTGARQVGKTSLLQQLFPTYTYLSFDNIATADSAEQNPKRFLSELKLPVILDEIQYVPSLFRELKIRIDADRQQYGQWILTGSQKFNLMQDVSESLAGRIAILDLETLSLDELQHSKVPQHILSDILFKGGYPELWRNAQLNVTDFFNDYVQTYLERDLRLLINVGNLRDFQRLMRACAARVGSLVNFSDLAKDVGISAVTVKTWINMLEVTGLIYLLSPYYNNLNQRLIKAPKIYFADNGLLCFLLNIDSQDNLNNHINKDHVWENFIFTETFKAQHLIPNRNLFFYRDHNGVEIDFVIDRGASVELIEVKNSENPHKFNFNKVTPLFAAKNIKTSCKVACRTQEKNPLYFKEYSVYNPFTAVQNI